MWVVRLSDKQLEVVRAVLRSEEHRDLARWDDLPEAELPWNEIAVSAAKQGVSEADVIWDVCGRHAEPPAPPIRRAKNRARKHAPRPKRAA